MSFVLSGAWASAWCSGAGWSSGTKVSGGSVVDLMGALSLKPFLVSWELVCLGAGPGSPAPCPARLNPRRVTGGCGRENANG